MSEFWSVARQTPFYEVMLYEMGRYFLDEFYRFYYRLVGI